MTRVIDGKATAAAMREQTARSAALLREQGVIPALAIVVPAEDDSADLAAAGSSIAMDHTIRAALSQGC